MLIFIAVSRKSCNFALVIELERHIEILLLSNDCVILPDLGGFMAHYVDARYDDSDGMFVPPLRTLGFNPQLTMNDSLLVQSYIEAYDMSYPEALRRIEDEVAELRQHLETNGYYELNDIGVLRLNNEGHIEFEPCEAGILTPELYGLSAFEMPLLSKKRGAKDVAPTLSAAADTTTVEAEQTDETDATAQDETEAEHTEADAIENEPAIVIKMSWLRNAAAVAAAIVAFFLIQTPVSNSDVTTTDVQHSAIVSLGSKNGLESTTPSPARESAAAVTASATTHAVATAATPADRADKDKQPAQPATPQQTPKEQTVSAPAYCIVLASQTTRRLAADFVAQLKKEGHAAARVVDMQNAKGVRVVYGSYSSEQQARTAVATLRTQSRHFAEAWVMKM